MQDEELLKQADEFLDMAFLGDGKEQCLMYKMKSRLEELTADKELKSIIWVPKVGEVYYYVTSAGFVYTLTWKGDQSDMDLLIHRNIYKTRALAEKAAPYQSRYNMVLQAVLNLEPDQVVDWSDVNQLKYTVSFNHERGTWGYGSLWTLEQGYPPLTDKKNVQPLLDLLNAKEKENG